MFAIYGKGTVWLVSDDETKLRRMLFRFPGCEVRRVITIEA